MPVVAPGDDGAGVLLARRRFELKTGEGVRRLPASAGAAWLSARFLTGRSRLHRLERWRTTYLPVFALWAAAVVVVLPLVFGFS